jgi:Family of unknown function (DUF5681)
MADYVVGYRNPPKDWCFKPGETGNSKGRPRHTSTPLAECIRECMEAPAEYRKRGQLKVTTWHELSLQMLVDRAANGDIGAAEDILRATRQSVGAKIVRVENWLPDHPGQTAEEKNKAIRDGRHAEPGQTSGQSEE